MNGNPRTFQKTLLAWFEAEARDLPWRRTKDPYRVYLSEIMLQQTRVDQGTPYYERFLERFPTLEALAEWPLITYSEGFTGRPKVDKAFADASIAAYRSRLSSFWLRCCVSRGTSMPLRLASSSTASRNSRRS